jgi:uncharacterized SAM-binding protein YcdF (DUF218 family)
VSGSPEQRRLRWGSVWAAALVLFTFAVVFRDAPARFLVVEDPPEVVDAVVVLAGDPSYERTTYAAGLVLAGQAKWLVVTGGEPGPGDSAASLRARAIALGVPPSAILSEESSSGTWESLVNLRPVLERAGIRSVALVTSPYHQRRASRVARRVWPVMRVVCRPARPSFWSPEGWWRSSRSRRVVLNEWLKLAGYAALLRL